MTAVEYLEYMWTLQGAIYKSDIYKALEREKEQKHASIDKQVNILKDTLDEMMVGFESEEDRMNFILDICNGYRKRINKSE